MSVGRTTSRDSEAEAFRRLARLCKLETGRQPESCTDPAYSVWIKTKRPFTRNEVVGSYMLKLGELCGGYLVQFHGDGTVTERYMFRPEKTWTCHWTLDEAGVIHLSCPGENDRKEPIHCRLDIVASTTGTVHAGCEDTDDVTNEVIEHFKVLFLGPNITLPGVIEKAASA